MAVCAAPSFVDCPSVVTLELDDEVVANDAGPSFPVGGCSVNVYSNLHGITEVLFTAAACGSPSGTKPASDPLAITLPLACQSGGLSICPLTGRIVIALRGETGGVGAFSILECKDDCLDHVVDLVRATPVIQ
jgi:hypothetical protein